MKGFEKDQTRPRFCDREVDSHLALDSRGDLVAATKVTGDQVVFQLPIGWQGDLTWSGEPIHKPTLLYHRPGDEFVRRATNLHSFSFGWDCDQLDRDLAALSGLEVDEVRMRSGELPTPPTTIPALHQSLGRLFGGVSEPADREQSLAQHEAARRVKDIVLRALLFAQAAPIAEK